MAKVQIDVYKDWLGIQVPQRPLNYYQILRLTDFEDDPNVIRENYRQSNAHVRKYATGEYMAESQQLLNELAKAMLCLTDATRKQEYDASLGRKTASTSSRRSLVDILLTSNIVPADRMKQVKGYADAIGIDLQEAVLQQKLGSPESVMLAYAESIGLPFVSIEDIGVDERIAPQINPNTARQHSFVPLLVDQGQLLLASPKPVNLDVEEEIRMIFEMPVRSTICTQAEINAAIAKYYPRDAVQLVNKKSGSASPVASKKSKSRPEEENCEPLDDEEKKDRLLTTIVAFNFTAMAVSFGMYYFALSPAFRNSGLLPILVIALAAGSVGGIAGWITWKKKS